MSSIFSLPVRTLSRAIVGSILAIALMTAAMSVWTVMRAGSTVTLMSEFERRADPSLIAQNDMIQALGYGGTIHAFKNYVLRGDEKYYRTANQNAGAALAALERLQNLHPELRDQLQPIAETIQKYVKALTIVREQYAKGASAAEIDKIVKISDGPALEAIDLLTQANAGLHANNTSKATLLADLRRHLGYGGMIHQFKNYVLRGDLKRIEKVQSEANISLEIIEQLRLLSSSVQETEALNNIAGVITEYVDALVQVSTMVAEKKTVEQIDATVKISDGPALEALRVLDSAIAAEGLHLSETMRDNLLNSRLLIGVVASIVVFLSLLTALGTREVLRRGVVSKQAKADEAAAALQLERDDFQERIAHLSVAASSGDFSKRIDQNFSDATLAQTSHHLNQLLDTIENGLNAVIDLSHALSRGDLTQKMEGEFEGAFARLQLTLNEAVTSIADSITAVLGSSSEISDYTANISSAASDLAKRTETQSYNLETSATTLGELTTSVTEISSRVADARGTAEEANGIAQSGSAVVEDAISAMDKIVDTSKKISKVTELIEEIAFQTNLLALNAGVEAARAGESGRGFAVVASEVLALAHRASDAVQEINDLISASELEIEDGAGRIAEAGASIKSISGFVRDLDQAIETVASSTETQASRLNQVNQAISELEAVTQQNASMFEQTAASIQSLNELTDDLLTTGSQFNVAANETSDTGQANVMRAAG